MSSELSTRRLADWRVFCIKLKSDDSLAEEPCEVKPRRIDEISPPYSSQGELLDAGPRNRPRSSSQFCSRGVSVTTAAALSNVVCARSRMFLRSHESVDRPTGSIDSTNRFVGRARDYNSPVYGHSLRHHFKRFTRDDQERAE